MALKSKIPGITPGPCQLWKLKSTPHKEQGKIQKVFGDQNFFQSTFVSLYHVSELASLNKYLFRYKWLILLGIACVVLSNLFAIYIPVFVRLGIDDALWISQNISLIENDLLYGAALKTVLGFGVAIFVASLLKGIFLFLMRQTLIVTSRNT